MGPVTYFYRVRCSFSHARTAAVLTEAGYYLRRCRCRCRYFHRCHRRYCYCYCYCYWQAMCQKTRPRHSESLFEEPNRWLRLQQ
jgi:hypothetical protein